MTHPVNKLPRSDSVLFRLPFQITGFVDQNFCLHSLDGCVEVLRIASLPVTSVVINLD